MARHTTGSPSPSGHLGSEALARPRGHAARPRGQPALNVPPVGDDGCVCCLRVAFVRRAASRAPEAGQPLCYARLLILRAKLRTGGGCLGAAVRAAPSKQPPRKTRRLCHCEWKCNRCVTELAPCKQIIVPGQVTFCGVVSEMGGPGPRVLMVLLAVLGAGSRRERDGRVLANVRGRPN